MKLANKSFENVEQIKYLGTTITKQNLFQYEVNNKRPNSGKASTIQSRTFVFSSDVQKRKYYNMQNCNFACGSVWV
jgi:lipopolysaccharide biosynthesis regulator YciM